MNVADASLLPDVVHRLATCVPVFLDPLKNLIPVIVPLTSAQGSAAEGRYRLQGEHEHRYHRDGGDDPDPAESAHGGRQAGRPWEGRNSVICRRPVRSGIRVEWTEQTVIRGACAGHPESAVGSI